MRSVKKKKSRGRKTSGQYPKKASRILLIATIGIVMIVILGAAFYLGTRNAVISTTTSTSRQWRILYVNQGNGFVGENNFSALVATAKSHDFNTLFFQIYRSGQLLFSTDQMKYFVISAHASNLSIFFALYFTSSSQKIPSTIYGLGEDGVSLDMSTLPVSSQASIFSDLKSTYSEGKTAITTTNFTTTLRPDVLVLETYLPSDQQYIHPGVIGGVEPLATQNKQDYDKQVQYALNHSSGVMVFDYYGLTIRGY
ncbi:MAG: hypothetical protein ACYC9U_08255 [Nitrososphaerales archaeon]